MKKAVEGPGNSGDAGGTAASLLVGTAAGLNQHPSVPQSLSPPHPVPLPPPHPQPAQDSNCRIQGGRESQECPRVGEVISQKEPGGRLPADRGQKAGSHATTAVSSTPLIEPSRPCFFLNPLWNPPVDSAHQLVMKRRGQVQRLASGTQQLEGKARLMAPLLVPGCAV